MGRTTLLLLSILQTYYQQRLNRLQCLLEIRRIEKGGGGGGGGGDSSAKPMNNDGNTLYKQCVACLNGLEVPSNAEGEPQSGLFHLLLCRLIPSLTHVT